MNNQIFTQRLKESIEQSGLTLTEISEKAEISLCSLKRYMNGKTIPTLLSLYKLKYVLDFECDYLLQIGK
ncbi:MAG: helix-turn-helix transcriptional regulator [Clostridia bacterium]|nr:helix-turn-helix transcriptional regulator [Clostridia bacterium]